MMVAADAPAIRLAPASNIASTFSATIRQASSSASASPTASFASRSRITSQDSNASMAPASQGKSASRGSKKCAMARLAVVADRAGADSRHPPRILEFSENALQILRTRPQGRRHFRPGGGWRLTKGRGTLPKSSLRANGSRERAPDDGLSEAILGTTGKQEWIASSQGLLATTLL